MIRNNQHTLSDFNRVSGTVSIPENLQKPSKHGKRDSPEPSRRRTARRGKLPRFTTSEERVAWMERDLVTRWPDHIKAAPKKWLEGVETEYGQDPRVKLLLDLILHGAKPVKKIGENGRKSKDTGMLPWNPHLVLMLDKLINKMSNPTAPVVFQKKRGSKEKKQPDRVSV